MLVNPAETRLVCSPPAYDSITFEQQRSPCPQPPLLVPKQFAITVSWKHLHIESLDPQLIHRYCPRRLLKEPQPVVAIPSQTTTNIQPNRCPSEKPAVQNSAPV